MLYRPTKYQVLEALNRDWDSFNEIVEPFANILFERIRNHNSLVVNLDLKIDSSYELTLLRELIRLHLYTLVQEGYVETYTLGPDEDDYLVEMFKTKVCG